MSVQEHFKLASCTRARQCIGFRGGETTLSLSCRNRVSLGQELPTQSQRRDGTIDQTHIISKTSRNGITDEHIPFIHCVIYTDRLKNCSTNSGTHTNDSILCLDQFSLETLGVKHRRFPGRVARAQPSCHVSSMATPATPGALRTRPSASTHH